MAAQRLDAPNPATLVGSGKVKEIRAEMEMLGVKTCIFDEELTPAQQRTLEREFGGIEEGFKVLDRTALILDIFSQHAASREGRLQTELALYRYRLPRLTRMWTHLERQSGGVGVGLRGPGETQLEMDRRMIEARISKLREEIEDVRVHRSRQRNARRKMQLPVVALVGYTNAGKSSLLNALTEADVLAENMLFATLDPTTRRASLPGLKISPEILITDTVGFISKLPTQLIAAFRATLEEVQEADVLLHVVDVSNPSFSAQMNAVKTVLDDLGVSKKKIVTAFNKIDLISEDELENMRFYSPVLPDSVYISTRTGSGIAALAAHLEDAIRDSLVSVDAVIPFAEGALLSAIYDKVGDVLRNLLIRTNLFCLVGSAGLRRTFTWRHKNICISPILPSQASSAIPQRWRHRL
uniref:Hflx-type G domain-containing protein n=1 Tax=Compsopogon caeruleus TaxID=31354 RepID=A0A7S1XFB6_9RHOD